MNRMVFRVSPHMEFDPVNTSDEGRIGRTNRKPLGAVGKIKTPGFFVE